ncbi:MAG TPA: MFS transporter, partial [Bryobacteraceae bacterium]|nr:MFS transporter [Bryobacteraceae bacterium]
MTPAEAHQKPVEYSTREQRSWYMYDFANSAFASTVLTLFLGPYLTSLANAAADPTGRVDVFGVRMDARAYWGYLVSLAVFLQVLVLPLIGAVADLSPRKKQLLGLCAYTGAVATMAMFFLSGRMFLLGGLLFLIANLAFGASIVVYNSFLPEIAAPEDRDRVSSRGWGIGYLGGGILLALNLVLFSRAKSFGLTEGMAVRISLASAGVWWALFSVVSLAGLRNRQPLVRAGAGESIVSKGFGQLMATLREVRNYPETLKFLIAFLLYNDAIQAVIALSAQFGSVELKIPMGSLTMAILMVQFVAFVGAMLFQYLAAAIGAKRSVILSLLIWSGVIVAIYVSVRGVQGFFIMAFVVGLVLGGSQALSRSLFSLMIPKGREGEYFS